MAEVNDIYCIHASFIGFTRVYARFKEKNFEMHHVWLYYWLKKHWDLAEKLL